MKFTRLRLHGFKSFVEPTELHIEPGLTAVVGPNGCGKSNLFDALRWVMGETRPTSLRGGEMDDVIFAGSGGRPARNMAEVTIHIDNTDRTATGAYNEYDGIEISRRIEREAGSVYRINGRDVRQKDVQLFFADASSGAGSTAFVRQGQIGLLISQKPLARRAILEEAAGIGGLHQRRHEAELRLRAAETNLNRLEDVIREVEGQLASLKKQARQASRYRNLSGHIRKAEALAHYLRWTAAEIRMRAAEEELATAVANVEAATAVAAEASTVQANAASELPPLRQAEAERNAALHRLTVAREQLDEEEARARETAQRLRQRIGQTEQDVARESTLANDANAALETLATEAEGLEALIARSGDELTEADAAAARLNEALGEAEQSLERLTAELAEWNARRTSTERSRNLAAALADTSTNQLGEAQARLDRAMAAAAEAPDVQVAEAAADDARALAESSRGSAATAREAQLVAEQAEAAARSPLEEAEREWQRLSAEAKALGDLLRPEGQDLFPPLVDAVHVQPGYEAALAAALGDDLQAPLDEASPHHWRNLGSLDAAPPLPVGAKPLSDFVKAPDALARRLALTGVVFPDQGKLFQPQLQPGQRLVSPRGDLWRWDGYAASADAPSAAAVRLAQRNRLAALDAEIEGAKERRAAAFATYSLLKDAANASREAARAAEREERSVDQSLIAAQDNATKAARAAAERASQLASLEAEIKRLTQSRDQAIESRILAEAELEQLGDGVALTQNTAHARSGAAEARTAYSEARATLEGLKREGEVRNRRLTAIADERTRWEERRTAATTHIEELERRREELGAELTTAEALPAQIAERRSTLLSAISEADTARAAAADARAAAETVLAEADKTAKLADAALSGAREDRARAQALMEASTTRIDELRTRIRDELECEPAELAERAEIKDDEELPALEQAEKRVEKLKQEREQLGGVNLRAEEEAQEQETRLHTLVTDRDDLVGAIERLRRGIASLNKEGRERLLASFDKVNANFQTLFAKLFEGGEAKLTLTESEDPLEAGLEIFARPPGKKLQSLALLSGGEQALTAMALIFAVFLVNPAPVCVLDEVDAPLDDANVERFCNMLDEMTRLTDTRFLVITHHALTMSRMHRLFGVTMAERGVSQLVSVTLAEAEKVAAE
ncbi:MAG: chromosome segregation protein SMC [Alphaproteobacteria bacterium]|nr:chromosome segregation protein SMC [Alphaproteobacteria bacterium]MBL7098715.1 chromosome segregation protein SMC [Alphaproteobacteria bacterium]